MARSISVTRALSELKLIDAKLKSAVGKIAPLNIQQGTKKINNMVTAEEYKRFQKEAYQSITDLIKQKAEIKAAIVNSNSTTKIKIGEKEMTVSDALVRKENLKYEQELAVAIDRNIKNATSMVEKNNIVVDSNLQQLLNTTLGKDVKTDPKDIEAISTPFKAANEWKIVDALEDSSKVLKELTEDINQFLSEVDFVLSESNSITKISVN